MKLVQAFILAGLCCALAISLHQAAECVINFVSHGTFGSISTPEGTCLQFVDDLGTPWEITNPRGSWNDGLTGTVIADSSVASKCSQDIGAPLRICQFYADESRTVVGTFDENQFVTLASTNTPALTRLPMFAKSQSSGPISSQFTIRKTVFCVRITNPGHVTN